MSTYKSVVIRDELQNVLEQRLPTMVFSATIESGNDSSNDPCLLISADDSPATTEANVFIRIKPVASLQKDIIGHDQAVFVPHVAQVAFEREVATVTPVVALLPGVLMQICNELALRGLKVELWAEGNGTVPCMASVDGTGGVLVSTWEPSAQYPLVIGQ